MKVLAISDSPRSGALSSDHWKKSLKMNQEDNRNVKVGGILFKSR